MAQSPTFIFSSGSNVIASEANSGTILSSQVNQNFSEAYCTINSINSENISSGFSFNISQANFRDSPTLIATGYFTATGAEEVINEIGGHWLRISSCLVGTSPIMSATTINDAIDDLGSSITYLNATASYTRVTQLTRPWLEWVNSGTIQVNANTSASLTRIIFPTNMVRTNRDTGQTLLLSTTGVFSAGSACAQAGFYGGSASGQSWFGVYAVGIRSEATTMTSEFVLQATYLFPQQSTQGANTGINQLNSQFGTNNWVYLGLVRKGNNWSNTYTATEVNSQSICGVLEFKQIDDTFYFRNEQPSSAEQFRHPGIIVAYGSTTANLSWGVCKSISGGAIPSHIYQARIRGIQGVDSSAAHVVLLHSQVGYTIEKHQTGELIGNRGALAVSLWTQLETGTVEFNMITNISKSKSIHIDAVKDPFLRS